MGFRQTVIKVPALLLCNSACFVLSSRLDFIFMMAPFTEQDESASVSSPAAHSLPRYTSCTSWYKATA